MKHAITFSILGILVWGGCSTKRPVLYPNKHLETVGSAQANRDIEECYTLAENYLKSKAGEKAVESTLKSSTVGAAAGAAGGAVYGHAGRGAGAGAAAGAAASATRSLLRVKDPSPVFMNYVNHCLRNKGYEPIGWE
jgi:hypothetical protein